MKNALFVIAALLVSNFAVAQTATTAQPFASIGGGPFDSLNLGSLDTHFEVPVTQKSGRLEPFYYIISYDSLIWTPTTSNGISTWSPLANFGWRYQTDAVFGYVTYSQNNKGPCPTQGDYSISRSNYVYRDPRGGSHAFPNAFIYISDCNGLTSTYSGTATDGSGITLSIDGSTPGTATIITPDGGKTSVGNSPYSTSSSLTNTNGNFLTTNGTTYTDTLGATALTISGTAPNPVTYSFANSAGGTSTVTVNYTSYTIQTSFGCSGITEYSATGNLITSITMPDNSQYQFTYEQTPGNAGHVTGRIASVTLPTGGVISYTYTGGSNGINCSDGTAAGLTRTVSGAGSWTYTRSPNGSLWQTTVNDPLNNQTVLNFATYNGAYYETSRTVYQGSSTSGSSLLSVTHCWNATCTPGVSATITSLDIYTQPTGASSAAHQEFTYNSYGLPTSVLEWDYGATTVTRNTTINYASPGNGIVDHPSEVIVTNGSGATVADTQISYDQTALTPTSSAPNHDYTNYSSSFTQRGNATTIKKLVSGSTYVTTTNSYDDLGNLRSTTDANGDTTSFDYTDNYSDGVNHNTQAFVTQTTLPNTGVAHVLKNKYYWPTGMLYQATDQNSQVTTYSYDSMWRPTTTSYPDGGQTTLSYPDPNTITKAVKLSSTASDNSTLKFDGFQRENQIQHASPSGTAFVDVTYDALGRPATISNPYFNTTDPTYGTVAASYDPLDRVTKITLQDGSSSSVDYTQPTCPVMTDEAGKKIKQCSDGLGRLISVFEDPTGLNYETDYQYDALGNLLRIDQKGSAPTDSTQWRTRTFSYDALSRMLSVSNPESGTVTYTYDGNGNVLTKVAPAPNQTGTATVTTSYSYDALNRLTQKSYSDGKTPPVNFLYDTATGWTNPTITQSNLIGRLSEIYSNTNATGEQVFSYDSMGRVVMNNQCAPSNCGTGNYPVSAAYDLAGNLTSLTYPSGRVVTYSYNSANWLDQVQFTSWNGSAPSGGAYNYWTAADNNFYASGVPKSWTTGSGITQTEVLNPRLQLQEQKINNPSIATFADHIYGYGTQNNGSVTSISDQLNSSRTQTFTYDVLNRLSTANESRWGLSYVYDAWHNRLQQNLTSGSAGQIQITVDGNNHIQGAPSGCTIANRYCYDAAGNLLHDNFDHQYVYDAESRMIQVDGGAHNYTYALDGNRVRKDVSGSASTEYIYFQGVAITERNVSTGSWSDYIFGNGKRIARAQAVDNALHIYGNRCSSCGTQYSLFYLQNAGGLANYKIRSGDKLDLTQYQVTGSRGGMVLAFTDGTNTNWSLKDQDGYYSNDDQTQNTTHIRKMDLSAFAGKTVQQLAMNQENDTAAGSFAIIYKQVSLTSADGTVQPIYTGQASSPVNSIVATSGVTGTGSTVDVNQNKAIYPSDTTIYYHANQVESSTLITGGNGWPVWQATYLPYGEEYNPEMSDDHYKFTGLERDGETSLDHTSFRQYSSTLGRWMTADPYLGGIQIGDPQSLNRYAYVTDDPIAFIDPLGLNETKLLMVGDCLVEQTLGYANAADEKAGVLSVLDSQVVFCGGGGGGGGTGTGGGGGGGNGTPNQPSQPNPKPDDKAKQRADCMNAAQQRRDQRKNQAYAQAVNSWASSTIKNTAAAAAVGCGGGALVGAGVVIVGSEGLLTPVAGVGAGAGCIGGGAIVAVTSLPLTFVGNGGAAAWDLFWNLRDINKQFQQEAQACSKL
jgi:RHS repeat-associated protein